MNKTVIKKYLVGDFTIKRLLKSAGFIYACLLVFALLWSNRMIFQPQSCTYTDTDDIIKIEMAEGPPISAVFMISPMAEYTVLYSHGNAEDLGDLRIFLEQYRQQGFSVLAYDYRGYGTSPGRPTTANACEAADAALNYLIEQRGIPLDRIIVHGRSVGGGPTLYLAQKNAVAGVIVQSSFVTAFRVLTHFPLAPFDKFRNIARIDEVNCPVLVIHGRKDKTIPVWHGEKLFNKALDPKMSCWLDDSTHNYFSADDDTAYWEAIAAFSKLVDT
jgi:fermentation-respiration switch protein FrsA (DUF1100 family)